MTNNNILRQITDCFALDDTQVINIFKLGDLDVTPAQMAAWFKKDDDAAFKICEDSEFTAFLNGWIIEMRGRRDGPPPAVEPRLSNNQIFNKLKIALNLQAEQVLAITGLGGLTLNKRQLSTFFRKPGHKHYRECTDQCLQSFLKGMRAHYCKSGQTAVE